MIKLGQALQTLILRQTRMWSVACTCLEPLYTIYKWSNKLHSAVWSAQSHSTGTPTYLPKLPQQIIIFPPCFGVKDVLKEVFLQVSLIKSDFVFTIIFRDLIM